jgi:hypothetical protein
MSQNRQIYYCPICKSELHRAYFEFPDIPKTSIGFVGFSGHGKTVYISSLFYLLQAIDSMWENYYFETLDDFTHDIMYKKVPLLKQGKLFSGTPINFPEPAFIRLNNMPYFDNQIVSMYDIGGGVFDDLELMTEKGKYLAHSDTIFFIVSLTEEDVVSDWNLKVMALLDRYLHVVYSRFGIKLSKQQNLVFVFSKSDQLIANKEQFGISEELVNIYKTGTYDFYTDISKFSVEQIKYNSEVTETWLRSRNCNGFINLAKNNFKKILFTMVSALGEAPVNNELAKKLIPTDPKGILAPFFWSLTASKIKEKKSRFFSLFS